MALLMYLNIKGMLTEAPSLNYSASALHDWAFQQDNQTVSRQMVLLFFFLTFHMPYIPLLPC